MTYPARKSPRLTRVMEAIVEALDGKRLPLEDEKQTQAAIDAAFAATFTRRDLGALPTTWPQHEREVRVLGGVIDFVVGGGMDRIGVEIKIKGKRADITRQLARYAEDPDLHGLVLVTARPVGLPAQIGWKPVLELDIGRAWL
jgi:hypothetical protein